MEMTLKLKFKKSVFNGVGKIVVDNIEISPDNEF